MTQQKTSCLRLILGDQLYPLHSWFNQQADDVVYVMMEVRQETDYVLHHAQKIIAIFAAMREMAKQLRAAGHRVHYMEIDAAENRHSIIENLALLTEFYGARRIEYQAPDEWRLDQQLQQLSACCAVPVTMVESEHFYTSRYEVRDFFGARKSWLMESFYRHMRSKHSVLMEDTARGDKPIAGAWNFDHDNRQKWQGLPWEPEDFRLSHQHGALWQQIQTAGVKSFGEASADDFRWPMNREEALQQLDAFVQHALPHFGEFQDAMSSKAWRLFHSLLSFALNVKMVTPHEVVQRVEAAYHEQQAPINAVEGFIRQIIGWREYVRGVYWHRMPGYDTENFFDHQSELPRWFWNGKTKMRCVAQAIGQSLEKAHAHHIQRLMVIGNFALLAGLHPQRLHEWYLGIYIDAFEWVELPNTLGMSQYADGGMLASKPYVSSAVYIDRMSDYCAGCHYNKKLRTGENACPFNALYWDFYARNEDKLAKNPRIGMAYVQLRKMTPSARQELQERAKHLRENLETL